jgi:hypothetical protein
MYSGHLFELILGMGRRMLIIQISWEKCREAIDASQSNFRCERFRATTAYSSNFFGAGAGSYAINAQSFSLVKVLVL